jgi:hypothetical protein
VFNDAHGDGVLDAMETSLSGWMVYLDIQNTGVAESNDPTATTDAFGNFSFENLTPGTYTVRVVPKAGWSPTNGNSGSFTITLADGGVLGAVLIGETSAGAPASGM